jgi:hypothetical protein
MGTAELAPQDGARAISGTRLNPDERKALQRCERIIIKGAAEFIRVGLALKEIKDRKLHRETHASFEAYCLERFDFKRAHGYRLIEEATAVADLQMSPMGDKLLPQNERQARELAAVLAEMRVEVMRLAAEKAGGKPLTAKLIREAGVELGATKSPNGKLIPNGGEDCVDTPDWLAKAIVAHFMPSGRVLEPCRGGGAFERAMPGCSSLDIRKGQDFLRAEGRWDWVVTNPPYSQFRDFLRKAMEVADNVVYLSLVNAWFVKARQDDIRGAGFGLVEIYEVPVPESPWPQFGMSLAAAWLRRGWEGGIAYTRLKPEERSHDVTETGSQSAGPPAAPARCAPPDPRSPAPGRGASGG